MLMLKYNNQNQVWFCLILCYFFNLLICLYNCSSSYDVMRIKSFFKNLKPALKQKKRNLLTADNWLRPLAKQNAKDHYKDHSVMKTSFSMHPV